MSVHNRLLRFAREARRDLQSIQLYGADVWGEAKAAEYGQALQKSLELLRDYPELGRLRPDLAEGVRELVAGQHRVLYRNDAARETILVLRVVHQRQSESRFRDSLASDSPEFGP